MSRLIRGSSKNARFFIIDSKELVQKALDIHQCSPTTSAAFGRFLTAGAMLGSTLKGDNLLTLRTDTDGLLNNMIVTAAPNGQIKGYVSNPNAERPVKMDGQPDVGGIMGKGFLRVIKDMGLKEPYVGVSPIQTGEIAEDLAYYYYTSEQTPSVVGLGVNLDGNGKVAFAGGFIIQLLPNAEDEFITKLEEKVKAIRPITELLAGGMDLERIAKLFYEDMTDENHEKLVEEYTLYEEQKVEFFCDCEKDKFKKGLVTLGKDQLSEVFEGKDSIEVECHFCKTKYEFTRVDLAGIF